MATVAKRKDAFRKAAGRRPTLQFCRPAELRIDPAYQRNVGDGASQSLIRKIAENWNWDLCQPLVVARRHDIMERLFVIDGQHRLEAARLRGDIEDLPCVIVNYGGAAEEASAFVALNQQRRPLSGLDLFKAAIASGEAEATAIMAAMEAAGLSLAPHINWISWKPGQVCQVGVIRQAWRKHGQAATAEALQVLGTAWAGKVLVFAGTIFPGIAAAVAKRLDDAGKLNPGWFAAFTARLGQKSQDQWREAIVRVRGENPILSPVAASEVTIERVAAGRQVADTPVATQFAPIAAVSTTGVGKRWCSQCDKMVPTGHADTCQSAFCSIRPKG